MEAARHLVSWLFLCSFACVGDWCVRTCLRDCNCRYEPTTSPKAILPDIESAINRARIM